MATKKQGELKRMRLERGLTQVQAAEKVGVDRSALSRYEDGSRAPTFSHFRSMRGVYGVTADALYAAFVDALDRRLARARRNGKVAAA